MANRAADWLAQAERDSAGAPFEDYGALQSTDAIAHASEILDFVRAEMAGSNNG